MRKSLAILGVMTVVLASGSAMAADGNPWRTGQAVQSLPSQVIQNQPYMQQSIQQGRDRYAPQENDGVVTTRDLYPPQNPGVNPGYAPPAYNTYGAPVGTGLGYPGHTYPGLGYPGAGYPGAGYSGFGYPGLGYPGTGLGGYPYGAGNNFWPGMGGFNGPFSIMPFW